MAGSTIQTRPFDVARHLRSPKDAAAYLSAALEENDPAAFRRALGDVARARSMATVAEAARLGRESLYFDTVQRVMSALGLTLTVMPSDDAAAEHG
jgi:probable addiction module antidote protein